MLQRIVHKMLALHALQMRRREVLLLLLSMQDCVLVRVVVVVTKLIVRLIALVKDLLILHRLELLKRGREVDF